MAAAVVTMATACGRADAPAPAEPPVQGVLSAEWIYTPASDETQSATGALTVEAGVDAEGPSRTLFGERGQRLHASLVGPIAVDGALGAALGQRAAMLYVVGDGNLCDGAQATHLAWAEPELIEGRTLAIAALSGGAPGEAGSAVCRVLRYTRNRNVEGVR
jgi:hypothetical protein